MSRLLKWSPLAAISVAGLFTACSVESPVAPTPDTPEDQVLEDRTEPSPRAPQAVPDEFIVIFRSDRQIPPGLVQQLVGDHGLTLKHEYEHVLRGFAAKIPPQALAGLRNNPFIERIEPNLTYTLETPSAPPMLVPEEGLRVRLVADDLAPGDVAAWPNRGSEGDAVQADASRTPIYHDPSPGFGGHASVGFNEGADDDEALEVAGVSSHGSATVVAVLRQEQASKHHYGLAGMFGSSRSRAGFVTRSSGGNVVEYWDSKSRWSNGTAVLNFDQTYVVVWRVDGGNRVDMQVNGTPAGSDGLKAPIPGFERYVVGMTEPSTSSRFDGQLAELLIYDRVLADCELDSIVANLGSQYGVAVTAAGCASPADPAGLAATPGGSDAIDLAWTDASANEDGFRIERRPGQEGTWEQIATTPTDQTTYRDVGLSPQAEYCYRVQAFNSQGDSNWTSAACATTDAMTPLPTPVDVPTAGLRLRLIANDLPGGEVAAWPNRGSQADAVQADATRRPVYHGPSALFGDNASVGFNEGSDNDEALEVTGVAHHGSGTLIAVFSQEDATNHNYGIFGAWGSGSSRAGMVTRSYSTGGPLDYWDSSSGWVNGTITVSANQAYVGTWRVDGGNRVDLHVNGAPAGSKNLGSGFPGFDRYVVGMTEPSSSTRFDGQVAEVLFYDRALADCELDQVVADLGARYSVSVSSTGGGCVPPTGPTGLTATASGSSAIDLVWTDASDNEDGFRIERRLGQTGTWSQIIDTPANETSYSDVGRQPSTEYCYRVLAFNAEGSSEWTSTACATTEAMAPLPPAVDVPTAGLRVRLIANDLPSGEVATWPNRGSEANAVQADATRRPVYHAPSTLFGDNASVGFNEGSDDDEALEVTSVAHHGSGTLIAVFSQEDTGNHNYGVFGAWGSGSSRAGMVTRAYSTGGPLDYWDSSNAWVNGSTTVTLNQAYVGAWRVNGGQTADLQVNGEPAGSKSLSSGFPGFDRYVVGMTEPSTSTRFDGQIAELLFYDRALANCELDQIVSDLGTRYGVSVLSTGGGCAPPADPTGLTATAVGYNAIDLMWTDASANEDGFRVERRLGQAGTWQQIVETGPDVTTYESRSLVQQTEYCYRVSAFNGDGISGYTDFACATTEAAPPGACVDTGNHDDLSDLYGIAAIGAPANQIWASTQQPGCEITAWYFGLDSGVDSDHPDLNVVEALSFVAAEPNHDGEDRNGHGTHTAGSATARDGNGGVVGVAPGASIHSFRVCEDGGSCQTADMVAAMDAVVARKLDNPEQPMVANMSIGGPSDNVIDQALRNSINAGVVYAVAAGNGILGACIFPADASNVSPARVGDDEILSNGSSASNDDLLNGVLTTTSHNASFADVDCNYGAPVSVAAPGYQIRSTWLNAGYNTISGTSMATPHAAGAALLYLQSHPDATPAEVEAAIVSRLQPWTTNESPNASGRLYVDGL
jgi:hypothetical protein